MKRGRRKEEERNLLQHFLRQNISNAFTYGKLRTNKISFIKIKLGKIKMNIMT